ncbi:HutD family protein [Silanimonas sp.]|jgi:environmental stress-induced protein Ves|uniref:HutD/Ves family protein n=1 Tax=Silanimonas sp. TaxID=1929290 RepID=UPI0022C26E82|nr:HutD family protein [Silanimonas sp.]MCZ8114115.1 HutD family protein [Silanimonas sp.]
MIELLPAANHRRERWKNGGGWTREILRFPADGAWDWRISVAEVGCDGPFSPFPGCEREIVLVSGPGMELHFADGEMQPLLPPHGRLRFPGERPLTALLVGGPTVDFNLIWKRDAIDAQLLHRPIVGSMLFFGEPGVTWVLYVLAGQVRTPAGVLEVGDAACLAILPGERRVIEGGGELLLAKLQPKA